MGALNHRRRFTTGTLKRDKIYALVPGGFKLAKQKKEPHPYQLTASYQGPQCYTSPAPRGPCSPLPRRHRPSPQPGQRHPYWKAPRAGHRVPWYPLRRRRCSQGWCPSESPSGRSCSHRRTWRRGLCLSPRAKGL